jgi:hypothetical protein
VEFRTIILSARELFVVLTRTIIAKMVLLFFLKISLVLKDMSAVRVPTDAMSQVARILHYLINLLAAAQIRLLLLPPPIFARVLLIMP